MIFLGDTDYLPPNEDILSSRVITIGFRSYEFLFKNKPFEIIDIGGRRCERKNWNKFIDEKRNLIFCVSFGDFDNIEYENIFQIFNSLNVFEKISNHFNLIFLLCNKMDLFYHKIQKK